MFHIDVTIEDVRIIATQSRIEDNSIMNCEFHDSVSGLTYERTMTMNQLGRVLAYSLSGEDGKALSAISYNEMFDLFVGCPPECRPIP